MKVTKLPSGNYRCRVYVGTDDTGKRLWKSFTGPNRKRVEQDAANHAEVRALHQQHPAADLHTYPSGSISEGNGTNPEWLQRDRGMTSVLCDTKPVFYPSFLKLETIKKARIFNVFEELR